MKRLIFLTILAFSIMALMSWVSCSNPLKADQDDPERIIERFDTVFNFDTTWLHDTVGNDTFIIIDTLALDTLYITDTLGLDTVIIEDTVEIEITDTLEIKVTDTLYVEVTDTLEITVTDTLWKTVTDTLWKTVTDTLYIPIEGEITTICSPILANLYEIFWTFDNAAGDYRLDFEATVQMDHPHRYLILDIDGTEYVWHPSDSLHFSVEQYISAGATIHVRPDSPHMLGHWVDLCMTWIKK